MGPAPTSPSKRRGAFRLLWRALDSLRGYFSELLRVKDADKPNIYIQVFESAELADLNYWLQVVLSISIATLGLILSSPAVVIGAMLISPLMGPIFGVGLALALGDFYLGLKSIINVVVSCLASILLAALITWILPFHVATPEILARVEPTLLDLAVAVLSGLAGAIVVCRGGSGGGVTALPGVAVAVALMPPLGVVGFGIGSGWNWEIISGGGLLFLTNLVAIILSSVLVFFVVRMEVPAVRREIIAWLERKDISDTFYNFVHHGPLGRLLGNLGTLPRRISILLIFLAVVCFPLVRTFNRIVAEAKMRRIVLHDVGNAVPKESLFQEDVEIGKDRIKIRLVAVLPKGFSDAQRKQLENDIQEQTGRGAEVSVYAVATREELAELARVSTSSSPAAITLDTVPELQKKLWLQIKTALDSIWPSSDAPLLDSSVTVSENKPAMQAHLVYLADEDLGTLGQQAMRRNLSARTGTKMMEVSFERLALTWSVPFQPNSAALSAKATQDVNTLATALRRFPDLKALVSISGMRGAEPDALALKRYQALVKALSDNEVSADRIGAGVEDAPANTAILKIVAPQH